MRMHLLSFVAAVGITLTTVQPTRAFLEDTPPTFSNGGVDPNKTADPVAVAAAQRALEEFFGHTNREFSNRGYANPWLMREEIGNRQSNWLDKTLPLACGRLVGGWKYMNWVPGRGWQHEASVTPAGAGASVPCEFRAPTAANGGVDPSKTADPIAVAAAQRALDEFYLETNLDYSLTGYSNPWSMRETLGNEQSDWLDTTLPLARGQLVGGWKMMNWIPSKGWCRCAPPAPNLSLAPAPQVGAPSGGSGAGDTEYHAWTPDRRQAVAPPIGLGLAPRKPLLVQDDPEATRIMKSLGVELGGEEGS